MKRNHVNLVSEGYRNPKHRHIDKLILRVALVFLVIFSGSSLKALIGNSAGGAYNTLMLDGKATDETALSTVTTGKLSLVASHTGAGELRAVPFYAYVIRDGKIVDADAFAHNHAVTEIEISAVLEMARYGDQMIIDPAGENAAKSRRVIVVRQNRYVPQFEWWPGLNARRKDGC